MKIKIIIFEAGKASQIPFIPNIFGKVNKHIGKIIKISENAINAEINVLLIDWK